MKDFINTIDKIGEIINKFVDLGNSPQMEALYRLLGMDPSRLNVEKDGVDQSYERGYSPKDKVPRPEEYTPAGKFFNIVNKEFTYIC